MRIVERKTTQKCHSCAPESRQWILSPRSLPPPKGSQLCLDVTEFLLREEGNVSSTSPKDSQEKVRKKVKTSLRAQIRDFVHAETGSTSLLGAGLERSLRSGSSLNCQGSVQEARIPRNWSLKEGRWRGEPIPHPPCRGALRPLQARHTLKATPATSWVTTECPARCFGEVSILQIRQQNLAS